ncbi:hypothetical protein N0V93_010260 [Gnomoniopsis smithogilvyi]|uniref:Uncharacterized protein n=1 Tax=Gnomoniopsis smithogilvyi TaxID=1191159 RepID=A0A9W9CRN2_9PEZI|nr:hypothetical protein N0V93_010260 [Gnomoniopsis smithogilvyi]
MIHAGFAENSSSLSVRSPPKRVRERKTGNWGPSEDFRLRQAVSNHGPRWILVAEEVGTRNGDQCAKRWKDKLNPELDHSQWSPEEDQRLLNLVDICGHNWKFMAQNFFQSRAPLSLKNRNSLLVRRLKRQAAGGERTQQLVNIDAVKRHMQTTLEPDRRIPDIVSPSYGCGMNRSASGSPVDATNMENFAERNGTATYSRQHRPASYDQSSAANNDLPTIWASGSPTSTKTGTVEVVPAGETLADGPVRVGTSNARMTCSIPFSEWGDQDVDIWSQNFQSVSTSGTADAALITGEMNGNNSSFGWEEMPITPERSGATFTEQLLNNRQLQGPRLPGSMGSAYGEQAIKGDHRHTDSPPAVEYSVTCRRGKVRAFLNHLMDVGMSEISERVAEDENVTIKLRIDV